MFKIDISALKAMHDTVLETKEARKTLHDTSHNAVIELSESGFVGKAQYASMESFLVWIQSFTDLSDALQNFEVVLETTREAANSLCKLRDELPAFVGAASSAHQCDSGELILGSGYESVRNNADNLLDIDYEALESAFDSAKGAAEKTSGGNIQELLGKLHADLLVQKGQLSSFKNAYQSLAENIVEFDSATASALAAIMTSDFDALEAALDALFFMGKNSDHLLNMGAGLSWASGGFADPKNINLELDLDKGMVKVSGYKRGDGLAPRYKLSSVTKNPQLSKLVAFKALSKLAVAATLVVGAVDMLYSYKSEYNRNPYLPASVRYARANAAKNLSIGKTVVTAGASAVLGAAFAGAAFGTAFGPAGMIVGALAGIVVGVFVEELFSSDFDGDGRALNDESIDLLSGVSLS